MADGHILAISSKPRRLIFARALCTMEHAFWHAKRLCHILTSLCELGISMLTSMVKATVPFESRVPMGRYVVSVQEVFNQSDVLSHIKSLAGVSTKTELGRQHGICTACCWVLHHVITLFLLCEGQALF